MIRHRFPEYLRLHTDGAEPAVGQEPQGLNIDVLCQKFSEVTGSQLDFGPPDLLPRELDWRMEIESYRAAGNPLALAIQSSDRQDKQSHENRQNIEHLAGEIGWLIDRLHRAERALWEREGELAVGIPVTARPDTEGPSMAERLEAILRGGTLAVEGSAAALYMLDEATTQLKLRSHWGLCEETFLDPPRPLRGARGDLEALTGHAVVIERKDKLNHWCIPEPFSAAVCIPISTTTMPLGTLWVFSEQARDFSDKETNLIEIIAGRIAVELEREVLIREYVHRRQDHSSDDGLELDECIGQDKRLGQEKRLGQDKGHGWDAAVAWQQRLLPASPPYAEGWDFAGCARYEHSLHGDHCFWHTRADGRVFATLGGVFGAGPEVAMSASFVAGAIRGVCERTDLRETVARVNGALWVSSSGDQLASIFAADIDPTTGQVRFVVNGDLQVFLIRPHGWESLPVAHEYCGSDEAIAVTVSTQYLEPDDIMVVLSCPRSLAPRVATALTQPQRLAEVALHHNHLTSTELMSLLRDNWDAIGSHELSPPALLVVKRNR